MRTPNWRPSYSLKPIAGRKDRERSFFNFLYGKLSASVLFNLFFDEADKNLNMSCSSDVVGEGRRLFESTGPMNFELYYSRQYDSGLMLLQYRRAMSSLTGSGHL